MRTAIAASSADLENAIPDTPSFLLSWASMADCAADLYPFHRDDPLLLRATHRRRKADFLPCDAPGGNGITVYVSRKCC
jgi:hypothetical protein